MRMSLQCQIADSLIVNFFLLARELSSNYYLKGEKMNKKKNIILPSVKSQLDVL